MQRILYLDPFRAGRHPFQVYLLFLCVVSGLPILLGLAPDQESAITQLPEWQERAWGASLVIGATLGLAGSYFPVRFYASALTIERIGLIFCGSAGLVYAGIVAATANNDLLTAAVILGFGIASVRRARDLGTVIKHAATISATRQVDQ